uniref:Uncharacterized protein n=1 Tax=Arundo donax TaxID=35708 RepID=A0A0A9HRY6_ARUDO
MDSRTAVQFAYSMSASLLSEHVPDGDKRKGKIMCRAR